MILTKTNPNEWTVSATYGAGATPVALTDNVLTFNGAGELTAPSDRNINIAAGSIPGFPGAIALDLGGATAPGRVTQYSGSATASVNHQDGSAPGSLQSYSISQDGVIVGSYSNGLAKPIGQIAMAVFTNP